MCVHMSCINLARPWIMKKRKKKTYSPSASGIVGGRGSEALRIALHGGRAGG